MAKPLLIKRIDLLVHPFFKPKPKQGEKMPHILYTKKEAGKLLQIWKKQVNEAAKDPNRLLLITPTNRQTDWKKNLSKELIVYAKKRMGKRIGFFLHPGSKYDYLNNKSQEFSTFKHYAKLNELRVNSKTVKTRGFGEYTNSCVLEFLTELNLQVELKDPIPYRNRQSTLLARKSVGADFKPWSLKDLMKTSRGRKILSYAGERYAWRRRENANRLVEKLELHRKRYMERGWKRL